MSWTHGALIKSPSRTRQIPSERLKDDDQELVTVAANNWETGQCCSLPWITVRQIQASAGAALRAEQGGKMDLHWFKMASGAKFAQFNVWRGDFPDFPRWELKYFVFFFLLPLFFCWSGTFSSQFHLPCKSLPFWYLEHDQKCSLLTAEQHPGGTVCSRVLLTVSVERLVNYVRDFWADGGFKAVADGAEHVSRLWRRFYRGKLECFQHAQFNRNQLIRHSWSTEV